jgi:hypothetical protein
MYVYWEAMHIPETYIYHFENHAVQKTDEGNKYNCIYMSHKFKILMFYGKSFYGRNIPVLY